MFRIKASAMAAAIGLLAGAPALHAQDITLTSKDGLVAMTGPLAEFDGETYTLITAIGPLSLPVDQVTCEGEACPDLFANLDAFAIAGSATIGRQMMPSLLEAYAFDRGGDLEVEPVSETQTNYNILNADGEVYATITFNLGESNDAFTALANGQAFIGLSSRRVNEAERNQFLSEGKGDLTSAAQERILALDGLALAVHPRNPIQSLSLDQISDIFAGNIANWREVGGLDAPIHVFRRELNAGETQVFSSLVMEPNRRSFSRTAFIEDSSVDVANAVTNDPDGIGLTNVVDLGNAQVLSLRSACGQIATPTEFSIKTEEYPMSRRMFLYTRDGQFPDKAQELLDYLFSDAAQSVIEQTGFTNQNVSSVSLNDQGRRLAHALMAERESDQLTLLQDMVSRLLDAERVSLAFRFNGVSMDPDNRATVDIARLVAMIKSGDFDGRTLMIIGFSDNAGEAGENQRSSQLRADTIRDGLIAALGADGYDAVQFETYGYGQLSPLSCNASDAERDINRRVEVWLR